MIIDNTAALTLVLSAAVSTTQPAYQTAYRTVSPSTPSWTPGVTTGSTNSTTAVTAIAAAPAGEFRVVKGVSVLNRDSNPVTVTASLGSIPVIAVVLGVGERLEYSEARGWAVFMSNGAVKTSRVDGAFGVSSGVQVVTLGANVVNASATANTLADVTGLAFPVLAGTSYWFAAVIPYTSAATSTGSRWTIDGPAAPTRLSYTSNYTLTATTATTNYNTAYGLPAASNASSLVAGNIARVEGIILPSADGTVQLRFASEIANSAITALSGAILQYMAL